MSEILQLWRSPDGVTNAAYLRAEHAAVFAAISELDALGHRLLWRAAEASRVDSVDRLVGIAMTRRIVTLFVGIRHLFETSSVEPSKVVIRSQFETLLAARYLVHAARKDISPQLPSYRRMRETRARYYMAAAIRQEIYRRQALLDGYNRTGRVTKETAIGLQAEIAERLRQLKRYYPTQQAKFGPLACYPIGKKRRQYFDRRKWYSFGFRRDTNSVRQLAMRLGWLDLYGMLYDPFSSLTHPAGISQDVNISEGHADVLSPYFPDAFGFLAAWSCQWQSLALVYLAKAYHPATYPDAQKVNLKVRPILNEIDRGLPMALY